MVYMRNRKTVLLLIVISILVAASLYLVYIIQDGSDPLAIFNTRAADESVSSDPQLDSLLAQSAGSPTPTIAYNSTSPSPTPTIVSASTTPTISTTPVASISPSDVPADMSPTPVLEYITVTPTPVTSLPVAGIGDQIPKFLLGGGLLVTIALFL